MTVNWGTFWVWALLIVGAGVALILYQHNLHTNYILSVAGRGNYGSDTGLGVAGEASFAPVPAPVAFSQFTGVWAPTGPSEIDQLAQPFGNPNYSNPVTYPALPGLDAQTGLGFEFILPGPAHQPAEG